MVDKKIILILIFIILLLGLTFYSYSGYQNNKLTYTKGPVIGHSDRVLVVAPHPDDETVGNTGIIRYCIENKNPCTCSCDNKWSKHPDLQQTNDIQKVWLQ